MNNLPKLTLAQTWLLHTMETLFMAAVVAGTIAVYQSVATGDYTLVSLAGIFLSAVVAVLSKGASTSIMSNANLLPAIHDTVAEIPGLRAAIDQLITRQIITSNAQAQAPQSPLVVVHAAQPTVQPAPQSSPIPQRPKMQAAPVAQAAPLPYVPPVLAPVPSPQADVSQVAQPLDLTRHFGDSGLMPVVQPQQ